MNFSTWRTITAAVTAVGLLLSAAAWAAKPDRAGLDCARQAVPASAPTAADRPAPQGQRAAVAASAAALRPALGRAPAADGNRFDYDSCGCVGG